MWLTRPRTRALRSSGPVTRPPWQAFDSLHAPGHPRHGAGRPRRAPRDRGDRAPRSGSRGRARCPGRSPRRASCDCLDRRAPGANRRPRRDGRQGGERPGPLSKASSRAWRRVTSRLPSCARPAKMSPIWTRFTFSGPCSRRGGVCPGTSTRSASLAGMPPRRSCPASRFSISRAKARSHPSTPSAFARSLRFASTSALGSKPTRRCSRCTRPGRHPHAWHAIPAVRARRSRLTRTPHRPRAFSSGRARSSRRHRAKHRECSGARQSTRAGWGRGPGHRGRSPSLALSSDGLAPRGRGSAPKRRGAARRTSRRFRSGASRERPREIRGRVWAEEGGPGLRPRWAEVELEDLAMRDLQWSG